MIMYKSQNSNFRHRKSTLNCKETGFQCPQSTLLVGLITVLSHLEIAQIRISCSGWTHQLIAWKNINCMGFRRTCYLILVLHQLDLNWMADLELLHCAWIQFIHIFLDHTLRYSISLDDYDPGRPNNSSRSPLAQRAGIPCLSR